MTAGCGIVRACGEAKRFVSRRTRSLTCQAHTRVVHHRCRPRSRPRVRGSRPRRRRPRRRDGAPPGRPRRARRRAPGRLRVLPLDVRDRAAVFAVVERAVAALRAPGRRRQQRRLRPRRRGGGGRRGRGAARCSTRNLLGPLWVMPGRAAAPARAGKRPHRADLEHRRRRRDAAVRPLQRRQVGARGPERGARRRGGRRGHPRHDRRARRVRHRLGRVEHALRRAAGDLRRPAHGALRQPDGAVAATGGRRGPERGRGSPHGGGCAPGPRGPRRRPVAAARGRRRSRARRHRARPPTRGLRSRPPVRLAVGGAGARTRRPARRRGSPTARDVAPPHGRNSVSRAAVVAAGASNVAVARGVRPA